MIIRAFRACLRHSEAQSTMVLSLLVCALCSDLIPQVRQLALLIAPFVPVPTPQQYLEVLPKQTGFIRDISIQRCFEAHPRLWSLMSVAAEVPLADALNY